MTREQKLSYALGCRIHDVRDALDRLEDFMADFPEVTLGEGAGYQLTRCEEALKAVERRDRIRKDAA